MKATKSSTRIKAGLVMKKLKRRSKKFRWAKSVDMLIRVSVTVMKKARMRSMTLFLTHKMRIVGMMMKWLNTRIRMNASRPLTAASMIRSVRILPKRSFAPRKSDDRFLIK